MHEFVFCSSDRFNTRLHILFHWTFLTCDGGFSSRTDLRREVLNSSRGGEINSNAEQRRQLPWPAESFWLRSYENASRLSRCKNNSSEP